MESWQDRVERKVDKLTEVVEQLARVEERQLADRSQLVRLQKKQDEFETIALSKFDALSNSMKDLCLAVSENKVTTQSVNKFFWMVMGSVVAFVCSLFFKGVF